MRKTILFLLGLVILIITGCGAKKDYTRGNYDQAISKAVTKLRKNPRHLKSIVVLEDAFAAAQSRDLGNIDFLKKEGAPENWEKIFGVYSTIKKRQDLVKTLPEIPRGLTIINVEEDLLAAKQKAADFYYTKGLTLLQTKNRSDARVAYDNFTKVKRYYQNFKDTDAKLREARNQGTAYVLFTMKNKSGMIMPAGFEKEILSVNLSDINSGWTVFHTNEQSGRAYSYHAIFDLNQLVISPEQLKESSYEETKKIRDGHGYELDENGNVKKDTNGNDIKVKKYKNISCRIIQTEQFKSARVSGNLSIYSFETKQILQKDPITSDAIFEHLSAKYTGNKNAMSKKSKELIRNRPVPFPTNEVLILTGSDRLKGILKDILYRNKSRLM